MARIALDLNSAEFQECWFGLERQELLAVVSTLRKIRQLDWEQLYRDKGLRWELIHSRVGVRGQRLYSIRMTQRMRAVCYRDGDILRLLSLHPSHDSAYGVQ